MSYTLPPQFMHFSDGSPVNPAYPFKVVWTAQLLHGFYMKPIDIRETQPPKQDAPRNVA